MIDIKDFVFIYFVYLSCFHVYLSSIFFLSVPIFFYLSVSFRSSLNFSPFYQYARSFNYLYIKFINLGVYVICFAQTSNIFTCSSVFLLLLLLSKTFICNFRGVCHNGSVKQRLENESQLGR